MGNKSAYNYLGREPVGCNKCGMKPTNTGWWFGTFFIFQYIGNNNPNWRTHISQRGRSTTKQFGNAGNLCEKMDDLARHVSFSTGIYWQI